MTRRCWLLVVALLASGCGESVAEYRNESGRFRIRLPGEPVEQDEATLPRGVKSVRLLQRSGSYAVAWEDLDLTAAKLSDDERLEAACDQAGKALRAKERSRKAIALQGTYPGRELILETADGKRVLHDRMYLVEGRLYQVVAEGERWWIASATVAKVLDSFGLIE